MDAIIAIDKILSLGLTNDICGIVETDSSKLEQCELKFGSFRAIKSPRPYTTYLYEWRKVDSPNEIGEPDALLIQSSFDGTMLIYLYELTYD